MRKSLLLAALVVFGWSGVASAQVGSVNLSWDDCWGTGGTAAKTFACTSNGGADRFVLSFTPPANQDGFIGVECVVDLQSDTSPLPDWWQFFNIGSCRQNSLNAGFDFTTLAGACADPYEGSLSLGGLAAYCIVGANCVDAPTDPSKARMKVAAAVGAPGTTLTGGTEYYAGYVSIGHQKTVGTGSCAGCATGVTLILNEIKSAEADGGFFRNYNSAANQCVTFNSGTVPCASLPARNQTWGQVKSLYR